MMLTAWVQGEYMVRRWWRRGDYRVSDCNSTAGQPADSKMHGSCTAVTTLLDMHLWQAMLQDTGWTAGILGNNHHGFCAFWSSPRQQRVVYDRHEGLSEVAELLDCHLLHHFWVCDTMSRLIFFWTHQKNKTCMQNRKDPSQISHCFARSLWPDCIFRSNCDALHPVWILSHFVLLVWKHIMHTDGQWNQCTCMEHVQICSGLSSFVVDAMQSSR